jgi:S1-C subfamily serine protease
VSVSRNVFGNSLTSKGGISRNIMFKVVFSFVVVVVVVVAIMSEACVFGFNVPPVANWRDGVGKVLIVANDTDIISGTGFAVEGYPEYRVTANHVCETMNATGNIYFDQKPASIVRIDTLNDLCLLRTPQNPSKMYFKVAPVDPRVDSRSFVFGFPNGINVPTMDIGFFMGGYTISGLSFSSQLFSMPSFSGGSGGPITNTRGEVIGVVRMVASNFHHQTLSPSRASLYQFLYPVRF